MAIQAQVYRHYRPGQCDDKNPSRAWHEAADAAIGYVACLEGLSITKPMADALKARGYIDAELVFRRRPPGGFTRPS